MKNKYNSKKISFNFYQKNFKVKYKVIIKNLNNLNRSCQKLKENYDNCINNLMKNQENKGKNMNNRYKN